MFMQNDELQKLEKIANEAKKISGDIQKIFYGKDESFGKISVELESMLDFIIDETMMGAEDLEQIPNMDQSKTTSMSTKSSQAAISFTKAGDAIQELSKNDARFNDYLGRMTAIQDKIWRFNNDVLNVETVLPKP